MRDESCLLRTIVLSGGALALVVSAGAGASAKSTAVSPLATYNDVAPLSAANYSVASSVFGIRGVVVSSSGGVGVAGYGVGRTLRQFGVYGSVSGPLSEGVYGVASYQEPATGPTSANETAGVNGSAVNGYGVFGETGVQHSQFAGLFAGVIGIDTTSNSGYNDGVLGTTTNGYFGVEGVGGSGSVGGAAGIADNGSYGLYGQSASNTGVFGIGGNEGVEGRSAGYPLVATDDGGNVVWEVDSTGTITMAGAQQQVAVARGNTVARAFVPNSTTPLLEDTGTATLVRGAGTVRLDPAFGASINNAVYQVFLTPNGESNGLYVSRKSATEFVVQENNGGRASIDFDYRIVAKPYASTGKRIAIARTAAEFGMSKARTSLGNAKAARLLDAAASRRAAQAILQNAQANRLRAAPRKVGAPESR